MIRELSNMLTDIITRSLEREQPIHITVVDLIHHEEVVFDVLPLTKNMTVKRTKI